MLACAGCLPESRVLPRPALAAPTAPVPASAAAAPGPPPTTSSAASSVVPPPPTRGFGWVLPLDFGVRNDAAGQGWFLAPRYHGKHNGIDLLAPVGTPVLSPCDGQAKTGQNPSHGKWAQVVCPLPPELGASPGRVASFFFAHLSATAWAGDDVRGVGRGDTVGAVGKSGNASGASVAPHLHLEAILQDSVAAGLSERHSGRDSSSSAAALEVAALLRDGCLSETELARRGGEIWRERRVDPFVLLACLGSERPAYRRPGGALGEHSSPFSTEYGARAALDAGGTLYHPALRPGPEPRAASR